MNYEDFELFVTGLKINKGDGKKTVQFNVQVAHSPVGEDSTLQPTSYDAIVLGEALKKLRQPGSTWSDAIVVGLALADALFPPTVERMLRESIVKTAATNTGLRLRLKLDGWLQNLPWEFLLLNRGGGEATQTDFLGLMPNVSIVRHKEATVASNPIEATLPATILVAAANPDGTAELNLDKEVNLLQEIVDTNPHIELIEKNPAQADTWSNIGEPCHLFHFIGHGTFEQIMSATPGLADGEGALLFVDDVNDKMPIKSGELAIQLRNMGVRATVLGACDTAKRDTINEWSNVAEALLKGGLGAVVGMQFPILDGSAIEFSKAFYKGIIAGQSVDEAMTASRLAIAARGDVRGWGTPVLYLRTEDGVLFPEHVDKPELREERKQAEAIIREKVKELTGNMVGVEINRMANGRINVQHMVEHVKSGATLVGADIGDMEGGSLTVDHDLGTVDGTVIGAKFDTFGGERGDSTPKSPPSASRSFDLDKTKSNPAQPRSPSTDEVNVNMDVETIERGGTAVGAVTGGEKGTINVGSEHHHVDQNTFNQEGQTIHGNQTNVAGDKQEEIHTGGGAHIQGNVSVGGDFVGRDKVSNGDIAHRDKIENAGLNVENLIADKIVIQQGTETIVPTRAIAAPLIEEAIRLDVAVPEEALLNEAFDLAVAVRRPQSPPLAIEDLQKVASGAGNIFREEEDEIVIYRIEVSSVGCTVEPPCYRVRLRPKQDSPPYFFQMTPSRPGKRTVLVRAYQESENDETVTANTRVNITVTVPVTE